MFCFLGSLVNYLPWYKVCQVFRFDKFLISYHKQSHLQFEFWIGILVFYLYRTIKKHPILRSIFSTLFIIHFLSLWCLRAQSSPGFAWLVWYGWLPQSVMKDRLCSHWNLTNFLGNTRFMVKCRMYSQKCRICSQKTIFIVFVFAFCFTAAHFHHAGG